VANVHALVAALGSQALQVTLSLLKRIWAGEPLVTESARVTAVELVAVVPGLMETVPVTPGTATVNWLVVLRTSGP